MKRVWALLQYVSSFFLARGLLFASPLLLASSLASADYAQIEWALASATLLSAIVTLGTGGLVPIVVVGTASAGITLRGIYAHHAAVVALALAGLAATWLAAGPWQLPLLVATLSLVTLKSTELKSHGHATASLFLDSAMIAAMAALAYIGQRFVAGPVLSPWLSPALTMLILCAGLWRAPVWQTRTALAPEWRRVMRAGVPLMVTGALATLITTSGRAGAGMLLDAPDAAAYSVLSRGAALPIVAHQIMVVAAFRRVFLADQAGLQKLLLGVVCGVTAVALLLWWLLPLVAWLLGPAFADASRAQRWPLLLLLAQAVLWSAIALNDLVSVRHERSEAVLRWSLPGAVLILALAYGAFQAGTPTVSLFATIHSVAMLAFYLLQCLAMHSVGVRLPAPWALATLGFLAIIGLGSIA